MSCIRGDCREAQGHVQTFKRAIQHEFILESGLGVHVTEWVGLKIFGVVSESQKRFRTATDAASREVMKMHVDTCRNGRTPNGG
jgi:hypothetical protein